MRIAFTSSDGVTVDQHFGMTRDFRIWEIGASEAVEVDTLTALPSGEDEEDKIAARASAVAGCAIVCTVAIGGPAAAKLVARRIHPLKTGTGVPIAEVISRLQEVLRGAPPPWLRKAMNGAAPSPAPLRGAEEIRGQAPSPAPLRGAEEIRGRAATATADE